MFDLAISFLSYNEFSLIFKELQTRSNSHFFLMFHVKPLKLFFDQKTY